MEYENIPSYKKILEEILRNDYYTLPANTPVDIRIQISGQKKIPLLNKFGEKIGFIKEGYLKDHIYLSNIPLKEDTLIGRISNMDNKRRVIGYSLTSIPIVNTTREYKEWKRNLNVDEYYKEDLYDSSELDISLLTHDYSNNGDLLNTDRKYSNEISRLQDMVNRSFLLSIGINIDEDDIPMIDICLPMDQ